MSERLARIERLVTGPDGLQWLQTLSALKTRGFDQLDPSAVADLVSLEICERARDKIALTDFGNKCADSAREYLFWTERQRRFHSEDQHSVTTLDNFRGKEVLELGPGWGCNLVRLASVAKRVVGLEIEPVYVEFSRILARREGCAQPQIIIGRCENTPFREHEFDRILIWNALQYADIDTTFRECNRLLRPGGQVVTVQALLSRLIAIHLRRALNNRNVRPLFEMVAIVVNTLWYQIFGKRLRKNIKGTATARPVHPTLRFLIAAAGRAGLQCRTDPTAKFGNQFGLVLEKQGRPHP